MNVLSSSLQNAFRHISSKIHCTNAIFSHQTINPVLGSAANIVCSLRNRHAVPDRGIQKFKTKDKRTFQQNLWKRIHKCGIEAKLGTKGLREALWRNFLKGRYVQSAYDEFMFNYEPYMTKREKKIAPKIPKRFPPYSPKKREITLKPLLPPRKRTHLKH